MNDNKPQAIKNSVAMRDVLLRYGFEVNRANFMCCPFHNEKTPSMRIYEKDYHCFGCGEHGDVIAFVQKLFGLTFTETLKKIDADFGLNLYGNKTFEELRVAHYKQKQAEAQRKNLQAKRKKADEEYWAVFDEWKRLDDNKRNYAPKSIDDEMHPLYVEAVQKLAHQTFLLECAEERRKNNEHY